MLDIICAICAIINAAPELAEEDLKPPSIAEASGQEFPAQFLGRDLAQLEKEFPSYKWREEITESMTCQDECHNRILTLYLDNPFSIHFDAGRVRC